MNGIELTFHHKQDALPVLLNRTEWKQIVVNLLRQVRTAFFTTKENGTGLGLAICESLAARNGCRFRLYSREGAGTVVVLQVPLH